MIDLEKLWIQYDRIIKENGAIILTAQTPFDKVLGASNIDNLRYEWIWEKTAATGHLNAKKMPLKAHENILVFYKNYRFTILKNGRSHSCSFLYKNKLMDQTMEEQKLELLEAVVQSVTHAAC